MDSLSPFLYDSFIRYNMPVYPGALPQDRSMEGAVKGNISTPTGWEGNKRLPWQPAPFPLRGICRSGVFDSSITSHNVVQSQETEKPNGAMMAGHSSI